MPAPKLDPTPIHAPKQQTTQDVIYPDNYHHAVVDTKLMPMQHLLTHLPGAKWKGYLYTQVKGANEAYEPFQMNRDPTLQQYKKIVDYELLLQGSLNHSVDQTTGTVTITGTCLTYPMWMVNYGDMWIADIGQGQAGLFTVHQAPVKKTRFQQAVYEIQLKLVEPMTADIERAIDLCVQETYYFQRDFLKYGSDPYVVAEEYEYKKELERLLTSHHRIYVENFFNMQVKTFVVPTTNGLETYDPYLVRAVTGMIDLMEFNLMPMINRYNVADFGLERVTTLWDCLMDRQPDLLCCTAMRKAKVIPISYFRKNIRFASIAFSGFKQVVVPDGGIGDPTGTNGLSWAVSSYNDCGCIVNDTSGVGPGNVVPIGGGGETISDGTEGTVLPNVNATGYVLSEAFYNKDLPGMTKFERLLWLGLERKTVNAVDVLPYYKSYCKWSRYDKFYLTPLLFILTSYALRSLYD